LGHADIDKHTPKPPVQRTEDQLNFDECLIEFFLSAAGLLRSLQLSS